MIRRLERGLPGLDCLVSAGSPAKEVLNTAKFLVLLAEERRLAVGVYPPRLGGE